MSDTEKQLGVSLQNVLQPREVDIFRAELSAALARCAFLEAALRRADGAITRLISDFSHVSDEHIAERALREPDGGYGDVIAGRAAHVEIAAALGGG